LPVVPPVPVASLGALGLGVVLVPVVLLVFVPVVVEFELVEFVPEP
jgi:hypothetical protein